MASVDWSDLPMDLLLLIADKFDANTDVLRLRAVCSSWRLAIPSTGLNKHKSSFSSFKFPFSIISDQILNSTSSEYFTISERIIYYLESFNSENHSLMVSVQESELGRKRIMIPLSNHSYSNIRGISSKVLNLLNYRISEIRRVPTLRFSGKPDGLDESLHAKKIVISSINENHSDCAVLALWDSGKLRCFQAVDENWVVTDVGYEDNNDYDDIIYWKGKFYAIDISRTLLLVIDSSLGNFRSFAYPYVYVGCESVYLVESLGNLYMVMQLTNYSCASRNKNSYRFLNFVIFVFDEEKEKWFQRITLDGQAFFIGTDCCFSLSPSKLLGCRANCIYFRDIDGEYIQKHPGYGVGMYYRKDSNEGRYNSFSFQYKGLSPMFWPPPPWLE